MAPIMIRCPAWSFWAILLQLRCAARCLRLCSARFPMTRAGTRGTFSRALSLLLFASPLLCRDMKCVVRWQQMPNFQQCPDGSPMALGVVSTLC